MVDVFNDISKDSKSEDLTLESMPILSKLKGLRNQLNDIQETTLRVMQPIEPAFDNMDADLGRGEDLGEFEAIIIPERARQKAKFLDPLSSRYQTNFTSSESAEIFKIDEVTNEDIDDTEDLFVFKPINDQKPKKEVIKNVFSTPSSVFTQVFDDSGSGTPSSRFTLSPFTTPSPATNTAINALTDDTNTLREKLRALKQRVTSAKEDIEANEDK